MREKIAGWPITVHRYQGKTYLTIDSVDEILALFREEIKKELLTDEEIGDSLDLETSYTFPCSDGSSTTTTDCRSVAQAQLQKIIKASQ